MRRICLVVPKYYPDVIAKRSAEALVRHGDEVDVICLCDDGQ